MPYGDSKPLVVERCCCYPNPFVKWGAEKLYGYPTIEPCFKIWLTRHLWKNTANDVVPRRLRCGDSQGDDQDTAVDRIRRYTSVPSPQRGVECGSSLLQVVGRNGRQVLESPILCSSPPKKKLCAIFVQIIAVFSRRWSLV